MSSVTHVFVIIGDSSDGLAEDVAPRVAGVISQFIWGASVYMPVISFNHPDWDSLQGGKAAGGAVIWLGWNYGHPDELEKHLHEQGFKHVTVWSQHEMSQDQPRVTEL